MAAEARGVAAIRIREAAAARAMPGALAGGAGGGGGGASACVDPTRMDLVLALDNSRSMADKQAILALTVPELVNGLVNPPCIDPSGAAQPMQPATPRTRAPGASCVRSRRSRTFTSASSSSSIGGHGADSCPDVDPNSKECSPNPNTTNNDKGHLARAHGRVRRRERADLPRTRAFWPGIRRADADTRRARTQIDDGMGGGLAPRLREMVIGVGPDRLRLRVAARELVPLPRRPRAVREHLGRERQGDAQRHRRGACSSSAPTSCGPTRCSRSLMLTDENDCSIKEYGQFYYVDQLRNGATNVHLPRARGDLRDEPERPVLQVVRPGGRRRARTTRRATTRTAGRRCSRRRRTTSTCAAGIRSAASASTSSTRSIATSQAFSQRRRSPNRAGDLVPNPIFQDLDPTDDITEIRGPQPVFFAGIVGVPWQDIARDTTDLEQGLQERQPSSRRTDGERPDDVGRHPRRSRERTCSRPIRS